MHAFSIQYRELRSQMPVALNMNVRNKISKNLCVSLYEITLPLAPFLYEKHGLR